MWNLTRPWWWGRWRVPSVKTFLVLTWALNIDDRWRSYHSSNRTSQRLSGHLWMPDAGYYLWLSSQGLACLFLFCYRYMVGIVWYRFYWVTQKSPQICSVILRICIGKVAWFAVYICSNFWVRNNLRCKYIWKVCTWLGLPMGILGAIGNFGLETDWPFSCMGWTFLRPCYPLNYCHCL